ncbi:MAG: ABC transporter permease [Candidatus Eremiobacteraeota bacterium]|nr:ABC transporter permease [Candidatus Eremiobacteraeota bacterium]
MRALIIKELQEKKTVLAIGVILCLLPLLFILCFSLSRDQGTAMKDFAYSVALIEFLAMALFYTMFIASPAIAGEVEKKNITFLLSLPLPRWKLWCAKLAACLLSLSAIFGLYFALNGSFFELSRLITEYRDPAAFFVLAIPLVMLSTVFFATAATSREMSANSLAFLLFFVTASVSAMLSYGLHWPMTGWTPLLVTLLWVSFYLSLSLAVFIRTDFFEVRKSALVILKCALVALPCLAAGLWLLFTLDLTLLTGKPGGVGVITQDRGGILLAVRYEVPRTVSTRGLFYLGDRLLLMEEGSDKITRVSAFGLNNACFTPRGDIDFVRIIKPQVFGMLLGPGATYELWRMDRSGRHRRRLYAATVKYDYSGNVDIFHNSTVTLFTFPAGERETRGSMSYAVLDNEGRLVRSERLPLDGSDCHWVGFLQSAESFYLLSRGGNLSRPAGGGPWRDEQFPWRLSRFDPGTGSLRKLYEIEDDKGTHLQGGEISADGRAQLITRHLDREGDDFKRDRLSVADLAKNGFETVLYDGPMRIGKAQWADERGKVYAWLQEKKDRGPGLSEIRLFNLSAKSGEVIYRTGKDQVFSASPRWLKGTKYLYLSVYHRTTWEQQFLLMDLEKRETRCLHRDRGVSLTLLSPGLTKLAFLKMEHHGGDFTDHHEYMNPREEKLTLLIKDCATSEFCQASAFDKVRIIRGNYSYDIEMQWRGDGELLLFRDPFEAWSFRDGGKAARRLFP